MTLANLIASNLPLPVRELYWTYARHGAGYRRDEMALSMLTPLSARYTPWTKYSMRPSGVVIVLNEICQNDRKQIVECGAGTSTLYTARLLRHRGGHVYAIEHDDAWASKVREAIQEEDLSSYASVLSLPLEPPSQSQPTGPWYSQEHLNRALGDLEIDMLVSWTARSRRSAIRACGTRPYGSSGASSPPTVRWSSTTSSAGGKARSSNAGSGNPELPSCDARSTARWRSPISPPDALASARGVTVG